MQLFFGVNKACQSWHSVLSSRSPWWWFCLVTTVWLSAKPSVLGSSGRDIRGRVAHGSCAACGHRRLLEAVRNQYHARPRDGARRHGSVLNSVDGRRRALTCLRQELSHSVCNEPSSQGRHADCRACPRVQKVERVSHPKAFAFEIGRVGRSCLEEGTLRPSYVARSGMS